MLRCAARRDGPGCPSSASRAFAEIQRTADAAAAEGGASLKRTLNATDLIMLGIGAVIGAGIFTVVGTAIAFELVVGPVVGAADGCESHLYSAERLRRT